MARVKIYTIDGKLLESFSNAEICVHDDGIDIKAELYEFKSFPHDDEPATPTGKFKRVSYSTNVIWRVEHDEEEE